MSSDIVNHAAGATANGPESARRQAGGRSRQVGDLPTWLLSSVLMLLLLAGWELFVRVFDVSPILVPAPSKVAEALLRGYTDGELLRHSWVTLQEILVGFGIAVVAALTIAFVVTQSRVVDKAVYPLVVASQTIPKVAIAPLLIVWFGTGLGSKVITTALISFFPVLVNAILGLRSTDPEQIAMFKAFGASRGQIFRRLQFPSALPSIVAGLDVAAVFAVTGAVVAEFVGATQGLGYVIQATNFTLDVATTFAVLVILSVYGLILHFLMVFIGRKVVFWSHEHSTVLEQ